MQVRGILGIEADIDGLVTSCEGNVKPPSSIAAPRPLQVFILDFWQFRRRVSDIVVRNVLERAPAARDDLERTQGETPRTSSTMAPIWTSEVCVCLRWARTFAMGLKRGYRGSSWMPCWATCSKGQPGSRVCLVLEPPRILSGQQGGTHFPLQLTLLAIAALQAPLTSPQALREGCSKSEGRECAASVPPSPADSPALPQLRRHVRSSPRSVAEDCRRSRSSTCCPGSCLPP